MSSDLPDVLRDMAENRETPLHSEPENQPARRARDDNHPIDELINDESGETVAAGATRRASAAANNRHDILSLQAATVPVLITVGILLILLGVWGTLVLCGSDVVLSDREDAQGMAWAMVLIGYPLGLCLVAGAGYFVYDLRRRRRRGS